MGQKLFKGLPTIRVEYTPGNVPKIYNVDTNLEIGGVRAVRVELLPNEVSVELDVLASLLVETTNVGVTSSEFDALLRLARFLGDNLVVGTPDVRKDLDEVSHLLGPEAAHAAVDL